MHIPSILHQTSKFPIPLNMLEWSKTFKTVHPNWHHWIWNDEENREFLRENYPWFLPVYDGYDVHIKRVDAVRYFYLYHYGGVYADMDFIFLKPLTPLLVSGHAVFGYQLKNRKSPQAIANAFMAAPPKHPLFAFLISNLWKTKHRHVLYATGPGYLTRMIKQYRGEDVDVYDMPYIYTYEWDAKPSKQCDSQAMCRKMYPDSYTSTVWSGSWKTFPYKKVGVAICFVCICIIVSQILRR